MHRGDVGPFGVVALVLTLLLQVSCAAVLLAADDGWLLVWAAVVVARLAMARTGLPGVPIAAGSSLGAAVAGTVSRAWLAGLVLVVAGLGAGAALLLGDPADAVRLLGAGAVAAARGGAAAPPRDGPARRHDRRRHGRDGRGRDHRLPADRCRALALAEAGRRPLAP